MLAVAEDEEGDLGAVEVVLDDDPVGDLEAGAGVGQSLGAIRGHDDALARCQAIGLDHVGGAEFVEGSGRLVRGVGDHGTCCGHVRGLHDLLRKRLRSFEDRGLGAGPEDRERGLTQGVGDPGDQWCLGADDDEVDV